MESDKKYNIPKIGSIPDKLYQIHPYKEAFTLLGFQNSNFKYERNYTNGGNELMTVIVVESLQWVFMIGHVFVDNRRIVAPKEFSIEEDLTLVEILAILWQEWAKIFRNVTIPSDLNYGNLYCEYIKNLKSSRPPKPIIAVKREYFRFVINQIKKDTILNDSNRIINISMADEQLKLCVDSMKYHMPVVYSENFYNEVISISINNFLNSIPSRFMSETVSLCMTKDGLRVDNHLISAVWDGSDLWKYDDYDNYLSNRLVHRSIWFGRY